MMTTKLFPLVFTGFLFTTACSEATFHGTTPSRARTDSTGTENPTGTETTTPTTTPTDQPTGPATTENPVVDPTAPPCQDSQQSIGAHIAFLIDNSNSNAATDCPSPKETGTFNGAKLYECQGETNREQAVLAAYDLLATIGAGEPSNAQAASRLSLASFPTDADYVNGWKTQISWVDVTGDSRQGIVDAMQFARKPSGLTPYGGAMSAAKELFGASMNDERAKVAVLVTDGEPTDGHPNGVQAKADELRQAGVKVITVFYTGGVTRAERETKHIAMLKGIEDAIAKRGQGHWFDASLANFDAYIKSLLGGAGEPSLMQRVASKVDTACQDASGQVCARESVEIKDSAALKDTFLRIIKTKAIRCDQQ